MKDNFLRKHGWKVIRLKESAVLSNLKICLLRIKKTIQKLGGLNGVVIQNRRKSFAYFFAKT